MKKVLFAMAAAALMFAGCAKFDDLSARMDDAEDAIETLQKKVSDMGTLMAALQKNLSVTDIVKTSTGYTIIFSDGSSCNLKDGQPGPQGPNGKTPQFNVDAEGNIYVRFADNEEWTILGNIKGGQGASGKTAQFSLDANGNLLVRYADNEEWTILGNIKGDTGAAGKTPEFNLDANGNLYVRFADNEEWTLLGNARGDVWIKSFEITPEGFFQLVLQNNVVYRWYPEIPKITDVKFLPEYNDGMATLYYSGENPEPMKIQFTTGGDVEAVDAFFLDVCNQSENWKYSVCLLAVPVKTRVASNEQILRISVPLSAITVDRHAFNQYEECRVYTITIEDPANALSSGVNLFTGNYELSIQTHYRYNTRDNACSGYFQIKKVNLVPDFEEYADHFVYDGDSYGIVTLSNGQVWMAENLHYVPKNMTIDGVDIFYPYEFENLEYYRDTVWNKKVDPWTITSVTNKSRATVARRTDDATIRANGLFYTFKAIYGEPISATNYNTLEGAQAICPTGWHIPTRAEWVALCGKSIKIGAAAAVTDTNALFYDAGYDGGNFKAMSDAMGLDPVGSYTGKYNETVLGWNKTNIEAWYGKPSMSYWACSTGHSATQMAGVMTTFIDSKVLPETPSTNPEGKVSIALCNATYATSVRCVKNHE